MLKASHLDYSFWAQTVDTPCYLQNCSFTSTVPHAALYELWTGFKPNLAHLQIFGCQAYAYIPDENRKKLDTKTLKCIFLGYSAPPGIEGYRLYHPETKRVFSSRDVRISNDLILINQYSCYLQHPSSSSKTFNPHIHYSILDHIIQTSGPSKLDSPTTPPDSPPPQPKAPDLPQQETSRKPSPISSPPHQLHLSPHLRAHLR